jgi:hypothetical protein
MAKNNAISKISKRAKQLQKKHPGTAWKNLIKKASAEYRSGLIPKKVSHRKHSVKKKTHTKKVSGLFKRKRKSGYDIGKDISRRASNPIVSVSAAKHFLKREYEELLKKELFKKEMATTIKATKDASRHIREIRHAIKKLI